MFAAWGWLTAALATVALFAGGQGWFAALDRMAYDAALSLGGRPASPDIVIVAVDDESVARIGRWPWRRAVHATLVEKLREAGADAIAFGILFGEADAADAAGDRALADAIRRHGRVVLPVAQQTLGPGLTSAVPPTEMFAGAAAALGHVDALPDADEVVRSVFLFAGDTVIHPQLALALLRLSQPGRAARYAREPGAAGSPGWHRLDELRIPFAGPAGHFTTISYVDVLAGAVPPERLRGRQILVGMTAAGLGDRIPTPMAGHGPAMSGIEFHANVLDALASGHRVVTWEAAWTAAAAVFVVLFMLALRRLSARAGLAATLAALAVVTLGSFGLLAWGHVWLPPATLLVLLIAAYPLWAWRRLEAAQHFMDTQLDSIRANDPALLAALPPGRGSDPLDRRMSVITTLAERQRQARQERDETMRFISHDLRSPLVSIVTLIDGLRDQPAGSDWRGRMLQIALYAQKALELADDFFRLAKAEAADPRKFAEVDLVAVAMDAADEAWALAERKNIVVLVENDCYSEALVVGDRSLLLRAVLNLVGNAVKYSPPDRRVRITLGEDGSHFDLAVSDEGGGIAAADHSRLFTRFGRLETTDQPQPPGLGLGLYIVKTIVERHGGSVGVDSRPGAGSTFRIRLPKAATAPTTGYIAPQ